MGNREDLLAGARRCLEERGWARTTVRDITAASGGVSMAAIGYHFGSREALLNAALIEAIDEWGSETGRTLADYAGGTSEEQYEAMWTRIIESFDTHRTLWIATFEALLQAEHSPELRRYLSGAQTEGRRGLTALLLGVEESAVAEGSVRSLGAVQMALLSGVITQWLTDPEQAPSASEVVAGLRALAAITDKH
ncbi:TetR/AcrR family transcriptional regulator [Streptosporangium sp. 'caverna']|uniref:TetR/AcrR family transcriptional regulator n=1 Tax=Streptosporangium sp. 'caverna' TaxID=2202249 RepID=UPI000D7D3D50|nr:TetR/AcrR family transcriptional regulator [Streptosporangium sp. 'caverna']AWS41599.1 TetR family transcriptional regulator [Streptosporangium sp. 'caverna']